MRTPDLLFRLQEDSENDSPMLDTRKVGVGVDAQPSLLRRPLVAEKHIRPGSARLGGKLVGKEGTPLESTPSSSLGATPASSTGRLTALLTAKSELSDSSSKLRSSTPRLISEKKSVSKSKSQSLTKSGRRKSAPKSARAGSAGRRADSAIAIGSRGAGTRPGSGLSVGKGSGRPGSAMRLSARGATMTTGTLPLLPGKLKGKKQTEIAPKPLTQKERGLLDACEGDDLDAVYKSLWQNPDINCRKPVFGSSPLAVACRKGNRHVASILLSFGADLNISDEYGVTPLHWAANSGDASLVTLLLRKAVSTGTLASALAATSPIQAPSGDAPGLLSRKDLFGSTALHFASVNNLTGVARALVAAGCDPTATNNDGRRASELTSDEELRLYLQDEEHRIQKMQSAALRAARRAAAASAASGGSPRRPGTRPGTSKTTSRPTSAQSTPNLSKSNTRKSTGRSSSALLKTARRPTTALPRSTSAKGSLSTSKSKDKSRDSIPTEDILTAEEVVVVETTPIAPEPALQPAAEMENEESVLVMKQTSGPRGFMSAVQSGTKGVGMSMGA
ncbi:hypothetical protein SpCBS45565_g05332 [Spizellomyces sp. 'palustris']|nr:hypothetical protein SpCBS45565_g05332 [Spizellomyces sp. 'palustris']